ncbi:transcriptional regulator [Klebsiella pneumoniae]|uniref:Transcriptional regulator n=2 Tax=Klebsiella pneumoniae complex TaxID=3390273 RepID=A0A377XB02_KLEPN|nr:transcriptional regulator [Klebsiella pneumoniae]
MGCGCDAPRHRRHRIIMIANHPEREQIRLENVLSALGNPLRLEIIRTLADGSELSCNAPAPGGGGQVHHDPPLARLRDSGCDLATASGTGNMIFAAPGRSGRPFSRPAGYAAESYGAGRISSSAGWRLRLTRLRRPPSAYVPQARQAPPCKKSGLDVEPGADKKKPEVSLRLSYLHHAMP